jgi:hypothetical protein
VTFSYQLLLDLDKSGAFATDISAYLLSAKGRRGRKDALSAFEPATMQCRLKNTTGRFSPEWSGGPYYPTLDHYVPVQLRQVWTGAGLTNICENPSGETNTTGISQESSAVSRETVESWAGAYSFKTVTQNVDASGLSQRRVSAVNFTVTAGLTYGLIVRVKASAAGKALRLQMRWFNSGGSLFQTDSADFTTGTDWEERTFLDFTAPATAVTARIAVVTNGAQGVFDFWTDAWNFYQASGRKQYVDGDQPGCTWSGTAHNSQSVRASTVTQELFTGYITNFDVDTFHAAREAGLEAIDRMAFLRPQKVNLGIMPDKKADPVLNRILDRLETDELIDNDSGEKVQVGAAVGGDTVGYTALLSASVTSSFVDMSSDTTDGMEGDNIIVTDPPGSAALEGWKYDVTAKTAAGDKVRVAVFARANINPVTVRLRLVDSVGVAATKTVTLSSSALYQYIELIGTFNGGSTSREVQLVTDVADGDAFLHDCLHMVLWKNRIERDLEAGQNTLSWVMGFLDPAWDLMQSVAASEPGQLFVSKAGLVAFRNVNSRSAARIPRLVIGDGDGLLPFLEGSLKYQSDGRDRVSVVKVRSRGTPRVDGNTTVGWSLQPAGAVYTNGDDLWVPYNGLMTVPVIVQAGTSNIDGLASENFGIGARLHVDTTGTFTSLKATSSGAPSLIWRYPSEDSVIEKRSAAGLPIPNELTTEMPFQGTRTAVMVTEANRLLTKYSARVKRLTLALGSLLLKPDEDIEAWQGGLELNDAIIVRSEGQESVGRSLGVDTMFYVEGMDWTLEKGKVLTTVLSLEAA